MLRGGYGAHPCQQGGKHGTQAHPNTGRLLRRLGAGTTRTEAATSKPTSSRWAVGTGWAEAGPAGGAPPLGGPGSASNVPSFQGFLSDLLKKANRPYDEPKLQEYTQTIVSGTWGWCRHGRLPPPRGLGTPRQVGGREGRRRWVTGCCLCPGSCGCST